MKDVTIFIYLDACRYDYISEENTPFLFKLSQKGFISRVRTVAGFTQEAAMMTGKYPDETGYFTWYRYCPTKSPFLWTHKLRFLTNLRRLRFYYLVKVGIRTITKLITRKQYPDPAFIPLNVLDHFDNISTSLPADLLTIPSICRLSKLRCFETETMYGFLGSKKCREILEPVISSIKEVDPYDLYLVHIGELDSVGHKYGPHPGRFQGCLREIDSSIRDLWDATKARGLNCSIVVSSDHGMNDIIGLVDIESRLKNLPLKVPRDYVYFLDSTMARFWFQSETARRLILRTLAEVPNGHVLSEAERTLLHIGQGKRDYGEVLFWVDKGYIVFPNFFQSLSQSEVKGMHGYMDDNDGALVVYSERLSAENLVDNTVVPLIDIFPLVLRLAGIPQTQQITSG